MSSDEDTMKGKSYLEILAENDAEAREEFEPSARDIFVNQEEHDIQPDAPNHEELEDQDEFRKEQGSHQLASLMPAPPKSHTPLKSDSRYGKQTYTHVISVDSRFRTNVTDSPSNFLFKMLSQIKNVISIRLSSIELPNTWYVFSEALGNTSMNVSVSGNPPVTVTIQSGNYTLNTGNRNDILVELFNKLNAAFPANSFGVLFDSISGKITISCFTLNNPPFGGYSYTNQPISDLVNGVPSGLVGHELPVSFYIDFAVGPFANRSTNWGLGYNLGFSTKTTGVAVSHTATYIADTEGSNYVFISLNPDWRVVENNQPNRAQTGAFAKIIVSAPKNNVIYDNGANTVTKTYDFKQPTNINVFNIQLLDEFGETIQLQGGNMTLSLEVVEVLNSSLYETMRE